MEDQGQLGPIGEKLEAVPPLVQVHRYSRSQDT